MSSRRAAGTPASVPMPMPVPAPMPSQQVIVDARAIAFLTNPSNVGLVGALIEREHSIGELAERFKVPLKNLAARVYRMVALGLARQSGEQPRHGRPIKRYRSTAEAYVLAPDDVSAQGLVALQKARLYPFLDRLVQAQVEHMRSLAEGRLVVQLHYAAEEAMTSGQWWVQRTDGTLHPLRDKPFVQAWGLFQLKPEDTDAFARDMQAVIDRYMRRNCRDGEFVMCVGSVVPEERRGRRPRR